MFIVQLLRFNVCELFHSSLGPFSKHLHSTLCRNVIKKIMHHPKLLRIKVEDWCSTKILGRAFAYVTDMTRTLWRWP